MKGLVLSTLVLLIASMSAQAADRHSLAIKDLIHKVRKGVIRVEVLTIDSPVASSDPGGGSGFVFEINYDQGIAYAITNNHVSGKAVANGVTFWDGAQYRAELVGREPGIDIALIKILGIPDERNMSDEEKTILPVVLGDSDTVQPGDLGLAMGSPGAGDLILTDRSNPYADFMMDQTATLNVVAGRESDLAFPVELWEGIHNEFGYEYATNLPYVFKMTTPINPGNSGGPLFNKYGEVIGINSWGGSEGMMQNSNAAVPINSAKDYATQMLETGRFERPWLGLDVIFPAHIKSAADYVEFRERRRPKQMEVFGVRNQSPAAAAGFRKGDIIVDVDGQHFDSPEDFRLFMLSQDIGIPLKFRVIRNGVQLEKPLLINVGVKRSYDSEFSV